MFHFVCVCISCLEWLVWRLMYDPIRTRDTVMNLPAVAASPSAGPVGLDVRLAGFRQAPPRAAFSVLLLTQQGWIN